MTTDTTERGLESLICASLTGGAAFESPQNGIVRERPSSYGAGWIQGDPQDYDREYCVDLVQLSAFLQTTQPKSPQSRWTSARTVRLGAGSWPGFRERSPSEGPSTCCAMASGTGRTRST